MQELGALSTTQHFCSEPKVPQVRAVEAQHSAVAKHIVPLLLQHLFLHNGAGSS